MEMAMDHWSDCAVNQAPAYKAGSCSCGGLNLANDALKSARIAFIPSSGRLGFFVDHMGGEGFIEAHEFPTHALVGFAAAANLPDAHDWAPRSGDADSVDLDNARPAIIAQLKTFARAQSLASS